MNFLKNKNRAILAIDIGNTRLKMMHFKGSEMSNYFNINKDDLKSFFSYFNNKKIDGVILSSTSNINDEMELFLEENYHYIRLKTETELPLQSVYHTPKTLGKDRVAGVVGARSIFEDKNCLLIDAGTCITYDLINNNDVYLGGNIAPGIEMRLKSMHHFTDKLPKVNKQRLDSDRGYSTESAIRAGAVWGAMMEIEGFVRKFSFQIPNLQVILTGGDAPLINELINKNIANLRIEPHLVLIGLKKIYEYNVEKK